MGELIHKEETYKIIGCCMEVYNVLGHGFFEAVYQEALAREFKHSGVPFRREVPLGIVYKGEPLNKVYIADFICFDKIIIETKALPTLLPAHAAQVFNYLKATGLQLGLLVNFGCSEKLQYSRHINLPRKHTGTTNLTDSTDLTNQQHPNHPSNSLNPSNPCFHYPSDSLNPSNPCFHYPSNPCFQHPSNSLNPSNPCF